MNVETNMVNCPGCGNLTIKYPSTEYCGRCVDKYTRNSRIRRKEYIRYVTKNGPYYSNNNLDPDSPTGIGYMTEILVSKFLGIPTCFQLTNKFNYPGYDLLEHEDWGLINVKGSKLYIEKGYKYHFFNLHRNIKPDFFFCIGYDKNRRNVLSVYYIPNEKYISDIYAITILMNGNSKYDWFKDDPKPWNELFHSLKLDNCPVLRSESIMR